MFLGFSRTHRHEFSVSICWKWRGWGVLIWSDVAGTFQDLMRWCSIHSFVPSTACGLSGVKKDLQKRKREPENAANSLDPKVLHSLSFSAFHHNLWVQTRLKAQQQIAEIQTGFAVADLDLSKQECSLPLAGINSTCSEKSVKIWPTWY